MNKLLAIYILLLGLQAHAGVLLEPFVGYDQETLVATDTGGSDVGATNSGLNYGARLGYRFNPNWYAAAEYGAGSGTSKSNVVGSTDPTYTKSTMGAVVGYEHGSFRVWGGYGLAHTVNLKFTSSEANFTGTNYKLGVGYLVHHAVSVNLEYVIPQITKFNTGGADADISTGYSKFTSSIANLSVSFPFEFGK